jgi:hypothetical protein
MTDAMYIDGLGIVQVEYKVAVRPLSYIDYMRTHHGSSSGYCFCCC